jgi:hypothetical protein
MGVLFGLWGLFLALLRERSLAVIWACCSMQRYAGLAAVSCAPGDNAEIHSGCKAVKHASKQSKGTGLTGLHIYEIYAKQRKSEKNGEI